MVTKYQNAVDIIKTAILQSQARAAKAANQEQLALYYGIGRYVLTNLSVATDVITKINTSGNSVVTTTEIVEDEEIRQLQLAIYMKYADGYKPKAKIFCKEADKDYAGYIMQDFRQPMGVATYKTADEMAPELLKALPPKEELQRVFVESSKKEE